MASDFLEKVAFEHGALHAVKIAARVGSAVPTGYRFELNPAWTQALDLAQRQQATEAAGRLTAWLQANGHLGATFAQNPEFARQVALLGKIGRGTPVVAAEQPATVEAPSVVPPGG